MLLLLFSFVVVVVVVVVVFVCLFFVVVVVVELQVVCNMGSRRVCTVSDRALFSFLCFVNRCLLSSSRFVGFW